MSTSSPVGGKKAALSPAEQILAGTVQQQSTGPYAFTDGTEPVQTTIPYSLINSADVGTISRSMTALGLSNTIPEEPSDVDLESAPLMNARRIASKSAIDLVGLNEGDVFDANVPLTATDIGMSFGLTEPQQSARTRSSILNGTSSFQLTPMPSRSIVFSNLSPLITNENIQTLIQMSGDVQSVRTDYRHQGVVQVTYFDIRAAVAAKEQLNGMFVADQCLNVQFVSAPGTVGSFSEGTLLVNNIDPFMETQQVVAHLSVYGDVKGVHKIPDMENHRLVEFYDIRHANAAMEALNSADATQQKKSTGLTPTAGMKQTMSLQQLIGAHTENDQEEDQSSRSWDGTGPGIQQADPMRHSTEPTTPTQPLSATTTGGLTKSMSFGSGLCELKAKTDGLALETPQSQSSRAVKLTPELAEGLRISDSASSLGNIMFPGAGNSLHHPGRSGLMNGLERVGMPNSASVETGLDRLDRYGQQTFSSPIQDPLVSQLSPQQLSPTFQQSLGLTGGGGMNLGQGYNPAQTQMDLTALLGQGNGGNLWQTIAAAQAAGVNVYDLLARLSSSNLGAVSQLITGQNRFGLGQQHLGNHDPMASNMAQTTAARFAAFQSVPNQSTLNPANLSSPSYASGVTGSGVDPRNMSKSASSPALHVNTEDRDTSVHRFGGRLSRRNVDPAIEAERRAQQQRLYALDLEKIRCREDKRTTLMIKNIPNKYTQKMLLASIDETLKGTYDFFYLPIDFKNKCNVGYGFINMRDPEDIIPLVERFHNKKWERFNSEKICCVAYGRIQGKQALINHFQNSSLMHEDKKHRPVLFVTEGSTKGEPEPFPVGSNIRPKITLKDRDFRSRERSGHWS